MRVEGFKVQGSGLGIVEMAKLDRVVSLNKGTPI